MKKIFFKSGFFKHCIIAVLIAILCLVIHNSCFSLHPGRDMGTYFLYYRDLFRVYPEFPLLMLFRTPVAPIFFGVCFDLVGPGGVQIVLSLLYIICLLLIFLIGSSLSIWIGYLAVVLLGANIQYYYWFFSVGSESPQSFLLVIWMAYAFYSFRSASASRWILHACLIFLLVLTRPGNQTLVLCAIFPLFNFHISRKRRIWLSTVFFISYSLCHVSYCSYNNYRYNEFTVTKMGNALFPFYRVYLQDHLVSPENGPRSRELGNFVKKEILSMEVYQKYRIDLDTFFETPTHRMFNQLVKTVSDVYGWDHNWVILRQVAFEAFQKHPVEFWLTYIDHLRDVFYVRGDGRYDISPRNRAELDFNKFLRDRYALYKQLGLRVPSEKDLLPKPISSEWLLAARPEKYPTSEATYLNIKHHPSSWTFLSDRQCVKNGDVFDMYGVKFPFAFVLVVLGCIGTVCSLVRKKFHRNVAVICIAGVSLINLSVSLMASVQIPFRFPFDSVFIIFGCFGIYGIVSEFKERMIKW